jgi:phospholipid-transporting ATPase
MIREAHIGIGLYGNEGLRAAQTSDVSIGEFRFLHRLLFFHGMHAYVRSSELILYFIYKNVICTMPHLFYTHWNLFSGQTIFEEWYIAGYNAVYTNITTLFRGTSDIIIHPDLDGEDLVFELPKLYYIGQMKTIFSLKNFIMWSLMGVF